MGFEGSSCIKLCKRFVRQTFCMFCVDGIASSTILESKCA